MRYRFEYRRYRLLFRAPVRTAHGLWVEREGLIVRLEADDGSAGLGEAAPVPGFGAETVDDDEAVASELGEWVDDDRLAAVPHRVACLRQALASARPRPSTTAAGGDHASQTKRPHTLGVAALLPAGKAALPLVAPRADIGFRVFKWKVGVADLADELSLLDDLCAVLPAGAKLRLDANGAWDRRRAERWLERCADRPIEFVEQPIAADARGADDLLLGLAADYPTPLALDESLVGDGDVERWVEAGWRGVFVLKPSLLGDASKTLERLEKARAAVVFSSALETAVGAREALRLAFSWAGEPRALGFGVWPLFADAHFDGPHVAPFIRREDVERLDAEAVWTALR